MFGLSVSKTVLSCGKLAVALVAFLASTAMGQETVEITSILQKRDQAMFHDLICDLGDLELGQEKDIIIRAENTGEYDVSFSKAEMFGSCSNFESRGTVIPSGGFLDLKLKLKTPKERNNLEVKTLFALLDDNREVVVRVALNYSIKGLLTFGRSTVTKSIRLDGSVIELELPFVFSDPIDFASLKPTSTFDEPVFELKKAQEDNVGILKLSIPEFDIGESGATGQVTLVDSNSDTKTSVLVSIYPTLDISVLPKLAYLKSLERDPAEFEHNFIIQFNADKLNDKGSPKKNKSGFETSDSVTCHVDGFSTKIKLTKVTNTIYRAKLHLRKKETEEETGRTSNSKGEVTAHWDIRGNGMSGRLRTVLAQSGGAQNKLTLEKQEAKNQLISSICSAYLGHTKMLERGDVIISLDETFDGFNEGNEYPELRVKNSRKTRLIFDFPKQRFLWVDFYSFNETLSSPDRTEPITISGELVRAVVFFDGECHAREFPREAFKYADGPEVDYSRIVKRYGIPDLRKVGLTPFNSLSLQTYEEFEGDIESFGIGAELTNSRSYPQASRQEVEFQMQDSDD